MNRIYVMIVAGICLLFAGCTEKRGMSLVTTEVQPGDIRESVTATGTVESVTQVDVGTQVTGIIDKLYADYNSVVKKGELIAEIEKTLLESDLKSADANMESARLVYEYNRTNYNRDNALHEQQLISDYDYQTSLKNYEVSKNDYEKACADRVRAAKNLNYAEIYSPIDGVVISRDVEVGQTVVSNMNVANLYTIADLDNMQIIGDVDEADIGQVKVGQTVEFSVDAYPDDRFSGKVVQVRLNPTTESNVVTYEVVVATENPEHKLIPGLTANLTICTAQADNVLLVPDKAFKFKPKETGGDNTSLPVVASDVQIPVSDNASEKCVWILHSNQLTPVLVSVGVSNGINTEIISGLQKGDVVALEYEMASRDMMSANNDKSPFTPQPPGGKRKK